LFFDCFGAAKIRREVAQTWDRCFRREQLLDGFAGVRLIVFDDLHKMAPAVTIWMDN
jgi:hypothetical protein